VVAGQEDLIIEAADELSKQKKGTHHAEPRA